MTGADGKPLHLAAGGFAQASEEGNTLLATRVAELAAQVLPPAHAARVVELYAGAGNLTVLLAARAAHVIAVESDRDACRMAEENLRLRFLSARVVEADAASYAVGAGTNLLVLDPPRTGARAVAERLAQASSTPRGGRAVWHPVRHVLYVSCDPQTLGRDLTLLAPHYRPVAIETFEMFPHTSHIETAVLLERIRGKSS